MARLNLDVSLDALESVGREHRENPSETRPTWDELTYHKSDRARQLQCEVRALRNGRIPLSPTSARAASPDDQTTFL